MGRNVFRNKQLQASALTLFLCQRLLQHSRIHVYTEYIYIYIVEYMSLESRTNCWVARKSHKYLGRSKVAQLFWVASKIFG